MQAPFTQSGIFFQTKLDPFMAPVAVADLNPAPVGLNTGSTAAQWTTGWPDGGPQLVAQPGELFPTFRERIITTLKASGSVGQVVFWYQKSGFFQGYQ
jgi:hypothetical protein